MKKKIYLLFAFLLTSVAFAQAGETYFPVPSGTDASQFTLEYSSVYGFTNVRINKAVPTMSSILFHSAETSSVMLKLKTEYPMGSIMINTYESDDYVTINGVSSKLVMTMTIYLPNNTIDGALYLSW